MASHDVGAILVVRLVGEVGEAASEALRARLVNTLDQGRQWLVIDLSDVTSMAAVSLTALASAHDHAYTRSTAAVQRC